MIVVLISQELGSSWALAHILFQLNWTWFNLNDLESITVPGVKMTTERPTKTPIRITVSIESDIPHQSFFSSSPPTSSLNIFLLYVLYGSHPIDSKSCHRTWYAYHKWVSYFLCNYNRLFFTSQNYLGLSCDQFRSRSITSHCNRTH